MILLEVPVALEAVGAATVKLLHWHRQVSTGESADRRNGPPAALVNWMSGGYSEANHVSPGGVSFHQQLASGGRDCCIASHAEMVADGTERSQKPLGLFS